VLPVTLAFDFVSCVSTPRARDQEQDKPQTNCKINCNGAGQECPAYKARSYHGGHALG